MKRRLLHIILCLTLLFPLCRAQQRLAKPEMSFGIQGGVEASMMYWQPKVVGTDELLSTVLLSGNGGFVFRYIGHKYFGFQVELNYMQRGWREKIEASELTDGGRYTRRLHYVELPFLMHLYFGKRRWRGFFNLGPQIGYCFKETHRGTHHPTAVEQYKTIDHPFDWGVAGGLGFLYRNPKAGVFQLEARFNFSFSDIFANRKSDYFDMSHAMNLSLNVGYLWEFKRYKNSKRKQ